MHAVRNSDSELFAAGFDRKFAVVFVMHSEICFKQNMNYEMKKQQTEENL